MWRHLKNYGKEYQVVKHRSVFWGQQTGNINSFPKQKGLDLCPAADVPCKWKGRTFEAECNMQIAYNIAARTYQMPLLCQQTFAGSCVVIDTWYDQLSPHLFNTVSWGSQMSMPAFLTHIIIHYLNIQSLKSLFIFPKILCTYTSFVIIYYSYESNMQNPFHALIKVTIISFESI